MSSWSRTGRVIRFAVIFGILAALTACFGGGGKGPDPVADDPMASLSLPGTRETFKDVTHGGGTSLGKPRHGRVVRRLTADPGVDSAVLLDKAISIAGKSGWSETSAATASDPTWTGEKTLDGAHLTLGLSIGDGSSSGELTIVIFDNS